ncbi:MAG: glutamine amidotransferase [Candidatus Daviesbacteria bacterium]|nr:glutamine amidotransferase [Candidatus Daviesbacteria bacterium]
MKLTIGYLYGDYMNIYGDTGNIFTLQKRAEWRGIEVEVKQISVGDNLRPGEVDLFFFGGGQDLQQEIVAQDLTKTNKGKIVKQEIEKGVPLLAICGGYQLLGAYYQPMLPFAHGKPAQGAKLPGTGLFPVFTQAGEKRMIGNIVIKTSAISYQLSDKTKKSEDRRLMTDDYLVGFENHSGQTFLNKGAKPLGETIKGFGNNGTDRTEGCIYKNAIGCYMHGSLLPKNPKLADWLIKRALEVKYNKEITLESLDDELENQAHNFAVSKFG